MQSGVARVMYVIFFDLVLATTIAGILAMGVISDYRRRGYPRAKFWPLFGVLFLPTLLAVWAATLWMAPVGPVVWDVYWVPALIAGVVVALLVIALSPSTRSRRKILSKEEIRNEERIGLAVGIFFWVVLVLLIFAVVAGYWWAA